MRRTTGVSSPGASSVNGAEREAFAQRRGAVAARPKLREYTDEQMELEREKIRRSPSILVAGCVVRKDIPKVPEIEQVIAAGAAVENLLLAATELGVGAMWKTGPAAYSARVKAAVGLAADDHIVAILHLGTVGQMRRAVASDAVFTSAQTGFRERDPIRGWPLW